MRRLVKIGVIVLVVIVLLGVGTIIGVKLATTPAPVKDVKTSQEAAPAIKVSRSTSPTRAELLKLVNTERKKVGVAPLKEDERLDLSAQQKADEMVRNNNYGHFYKGVFIGQKYINATGIACVLDDENLAWMSYSQLQSARSAMDWWMKSTPHRTAILNSKYTITGFGIVHDAVVEHFCQP